MTKINNVFSKNNWAVLLLFFAITGCERELSDEAVFAEFPANGDVFTDAFSAGLDYFPFVGEGADPEAFSVVTDEVFEGNAAMRFDVPSFGNGFVGATFNTTVKRNLTGFDALTFYAKASQAATLNEVGFGIDGDTNNKYQTTLRGLEISTTWKKYIIPIPDASKLIGEAGLFWLGEGASFAGDEGGYTFWLDEVKFEKLGTLAQPQPKILGGMHIEQPAFLNVPITITGFSQTLNSASGDNITVNTTAAFFDFESSDTSVAIVDESGVVSILGNGMATITSIVNGVVAEGSLTLNVSGGFDFAPIPPERNTEDVISIFSDVYNNVPVDYYNGFFLDGFQTTEGGAPPLNVNGDAIINYTMLNFVGIGTFEDVPSVNISEMTHLHIDIKANENVVPGDFVNIQLLNSVGSNETSGTVQFNASNFQQDVWTSLDIPIADFGLNDVSQIGLLFFISDGTISDIFVDNIYYYR